jgi:hypothetical protein
MPPSLILATGALLFFGRFTKNDFYAIIDKESCPSETVLLAIRSRVSSTRESFESEVKAHGSSQSTYFVRLAHSSHPRRGRSDCCGDYVASAIPDEGSDASPSTDSANIVSVSPEHASCDSADASTDSVEYAIAGCIADDTRQYAVLIASANLPRR